jgi:GTP-binding protein EngB required for normal cell division
MSHRKKTYVMEHQAIAEQKLAARLELLKSRGLDGAALEKESFIKKLRADIRKARRQLIAIADEEKQEVERAQTKADKLAAKNNPEQAPAAKPAPADKKPKQEKKIKEKKKSS